MRHSINRQSIHHSSFILHPSSLFPRLPDVPVSPSFVASTCTSGASCIRPSRVKCRDAVGPQEIVGRQSAGESGRAAGGQHVRRAGGVVAQAPPACNCPGTSRRRGESSRPTPRRSAVAMCRCSGAISSVSAQASSASRARITAPNSSRLCRASSPRSTCAKLPFESSPRPRPAPSRPSRSGRSRPGHVRPGRSGRRP